MSRRWRSTQRPSPAPGGGRRSGPAALCRNRALVGGTTSIQGNPKGATPPDNDLIRIDTEKLGTNQDFIRVRTIVADTLADLQRLAAADATLVWSPFANFWLYGATANITAAKAAGVRIALGSDWAPSGTATSSGSSKSPSGLLSSLRNYT